MKNLISAIIALVVCLPVYATNNCASGVSYGHSNFNYAQNFATNYAASSYNYANYAPVVAVPIVAVPVEKVEVKVQTPVAYQPIVVTAPTVAEYSAPVVGYQLYALQQQYNNYSNVLANTGYSANIGSYGQNLSHGHSNVSFSRVQRINHGARHGGGFSQNQVVVQKTRLVTVNTRQRQNFGLMQQLRSRVRFRQNFSTINNNTVYYSQPQQLQQRVIRTEVITLRQNNVNRVYQCGVDGNNNIVSVQEIQTIQSGY